VAEVRDGNAFEANAVPGASPGASTTTIL